MICLASMIAVPSWLFIAGMLIFMFTIIAIFQRSDNNYLRHENRWHRHYYDRSQDYYDPHHAGYQRPLQPELELRPRRRNPLGMFLAIVFLAAILALFMMNGTSQAPAVPENQRDSLSRANIVEDLGTSDWEMPSRLPEPNTPLITVNDSIYADNEYDIQPQPEVVRLIAFVPRFTLQVGFYLDAENAIRIHDRLEARYPDRRVWMQVGWSKLDQKGFFVFIGEFEDETAANRFGLQLQRKGFDKGFPVPLVLP